MPQVGGPDGRLGSRQRRSSIYSIPPDPLPSYPYLLCAHAIALVPSLAFITLFVTLSLRIHCHLPHLRLAVVDTLAQPQSSHDRYGSEGSRCHALLGSHSSLSWALVALSVASYTAAHKLRSLISHSTALIFRLLQTFIATLLPLSTLGKDLEPEQEDKAIVIVACIAKAVFSELFKACLILCACAITIAKVHLDAIFADEDDFSRRPNVALIASSDAVLTKTKGVDLLDQIRWSMLDPQQASFRVVIWLALGWSIADFTRGTIELFRHLAMYAPVFLPEGNRPEDEEEGDSFWYSQAPQHSRELGSQPLMDTQRAVKDDYGAAEGQVPSTTSQTWPPMTDLNETSLPLTLAEYERYGRQMILPSFGLEGQRRLRKARVLVIGAGGLGCPAVQYLAAAGVGYISVVDHDVVERSNLARQILHTETRIGLSKAKSVQEAVKDINPHVTVTPVVALFCAANATALMESHDLVLDCTDNPLTRYLINDAAVLEDKMVISGAGQGYEGQVIVLHRHLPMEERGPCYRCIFPSAPKPSEVTNCEDSGVLGTVTGLVGTLQAMEAVKIIVGLGDPQENTTMLLVSPLSTPAFRTIKIRSKKKECVVCGAGGVGQRKITSLEDADYVAFCGLDAASPQVDRSNTSNEATVTQLARADRQPDLLVDVRSKEEFGIVALLGAKNLPFSDIRRDPLQALASIEALLPTRSQASGHSPLVHLICTRGNDSRLASSILSEENQQRAAKAGGVSMAFVNVHGGLRAWHEEVDHHFPNYWGGGGGSQRGSRPEDEPRKGSIDPFGASARQRPLSAFLLSSAKSTVINGNAKSSRPHDGEGDSMSSSTSTHSSSDESELSMIAQLEEQIDRLVAARTRVKLEQLLGASLPELPTALAALWRLDSALWSIGSLLLLSSSLALSQGPLFSLLPPRRGDDPAVLFPSVSRMWLTYTTLAILHSTSDATWRLGLPRLGWATVTYGSLLVGIGMMLVGLARWGLVV